MNEKIVAYCYNGCGGIVAYGNLNTWSHTCPNPPTYWTGFENLGDDAERFFALHEDIK